MEKLNAQVLVRPSLQIQGSGEPFFWMHGMLSSIETDAYFSFFDFNTAAANTRLIRFESAGQNPEGNYTWPSLSEELIELADELQIETFIAGGTSMGSGTALITAVNHPERVKALVLVTPPPAWEMRNDQKVQYMRIANKLTAENYQSLLGKIMRINPDPPAFVEEVLPGIQEEMIRRRLNFPVEYMRSIYRDAALSDMPDREILKKLNVPTFILGVADDPNHPVAMAEELHRLIKNSELHILKNYTDVLCRKSIFQKFFEKFCTK